MGNNYPVSATTIGLGKETTRHTAANSFSWAKARAPKYKPNQSLLDDNTLQGSMVMNYDAIPGLRYDSHGWTTFPYMDILPLYVMGELGSPDTKTAAPGSTTVQGSGTKGTGTIPSAASVAANSWIVINQGAATQETQFVTAVAGTTAPYTLTLKHNLVFNHVNGEAIAGLTNHGFSLLNSSVGVNGNQPPSFTIVDFDGEEWRELTGAQLDKFSLKLSPNKLAELDVDWFADAAVSTSQTASFTAPQAPPSWRMQMSIGGTDILYVEDYSLNLARGVKPIEAFQGSQAYYSYFAGPLQASAKITVIEQSAAPELTQYLAGTKEEIDVQISDNSSGYGARFHCQSAIFKTGELVRGKEWLEATLDVQLLPTATDATAGGVSPIYVTVGNGTSTAY